MSPTFGLWTTLRVTVIFEPKFQAPKMEVRTTPTPTPMARLYITERTVTTTTTMPSLGRMRVSLAKVAQWNVLITTMKSTPVSPAMGRSSITGEATRMKIRRKTPADVLERRPRAPFMMLMVDCPIMASPPMAPNKDETKFAKPWATDSWFARKTDCGVLVISLQAWRVMMDSTRPMAAKLKAYSMMTPQRGEPPTSAKSKGGKLPLTPAVSDTMRVGTSRMARLTPCSQTLATMSATMDPGRNLPTFGIFGQRCMTIMVMITMTIIIQVVVCASVRSSRSDSLQSVNNL
mmetsp:Transcript_2370/g.6917  ORF Transcript_2370/g.6917 Transcript_2370/m.6917 type:complete len:290 (-) Transcript_2370:637-1506(-)